MNYKIGVFGSTRVEALGDEVLNWSFFLGKEIALNKHILMTGGSNGVVKKCIEGCKTGDGIAISFLPNLCEMYKELKSNMNININTDMNLVQRSSLLVNSIDFAIAVQGGAGTLLEIIMSYLQRKMIIVTNSFKKKDDPNILLILNHIKTLKLNNILVQYGWLDSKLHSMVTPIYVINDFISPSDILKLADVIVNQKKIYENNKNI